VKKGAWYTKLSLAKKKVIKPEPVKSTKTGKPGFGKRSLSERWKLPKNPI